MKAGNIYASNIEKQLSPSNTLQCCISLVYGHCLNPFLSKRVFTYLQSKSFENTVGKGEIARIEQFLLFPQCFLPILVTFCLLQFEVVICKLLQFGRV